MSNIGMTLALKAMGIDYTITDVGDRYVLEAMVAKGASLGGEDSGHLIFLQHHTTGDGILSALQVLGAMKKRQKPLSELAGIMTVYPQILLNVETKSRPDLSTIPAISGVIADVEKALGERGTGAGPLFGDPESVPRHGRGPDAGGNGNILQKNYGRGPGRTRLIGLGYGRTD